jgi:hypothetical protein
MGRHWQRLLLVAALTAWNASRLTSQMPLVTRLTSQQNPRGIEWRKIETTHFSVIFPDSLEHEARRAAQLLERAYTPLGNSLRTRPERIPVVLNNQSLTSNAYVAWSPRRSQWYSLPNMTVDALGPIEWYRLLALHEGRHVVQERAIRTGWIGLASRVFGENTTGVLGGSFYFPSWFWEGDAVGTETALSGLGRGRQPAFTARTRALASGGARNDYYSTWQGSYRTILPDWYEQGYAITSYVRRHYGDSAWARAIRSAAWNPLPPFALTMALKRITGSGVPELHRKAVTELDSLWRAERAGLRETAAEVLSPARENYQAWSLPQYAGDGSVIATYFDLNTPPQLVRLRNGRKEVLVARTGIVGDLQFHVRGDRVVWAEYEVDPRYGERSYLVIKRLDLGTGKVTRLTDRSRYYGPSLSPDGRQIAAVHFDQSRRADLVILDAESGREVRRVPNASGAHLVTPAWGPDGRSLYVAAIDSVRGNALMRVALDGPAASWRTVIDFTTSAISRPVASGVMVYYGSPRSGIDNVWAVDTASGRRFQITSRQLGASTPSLSADGTRLLFADLTADGYRIAVAQVDTASWIADDRVAAPTFPYADVLAIQERALMTVPGNAELASARADSASLTSVPYRGWGRLFDFHSMVLSPTADGINTGLSLESRNLLNTFGVSVGVTFSEEGTSALEVGASYAGLPVILDAALRVGSRASTYSDSAGTHGFSWNERSATVGARLPLTRVFGLNRQSVLVSAGLGVTRITDQPVAFRFDNNNGTFTPANYSVRASHTRAGAYRDLFATGAVASVGYRHTPFSEDYRGHQLSLDGAVFSRGIFVNHALVLSASHEERRTGNYRFASDVAFPRGFRRIYHERTSAVGATYHAPLFYPDFAVGPLVYARRVQGNIFADVARGSTRDGARRADYRSVGAELTTDLAFFGTRSTTRIGVRWSKRLTGDKATVTDFVLLLPGG